MGSLDIIGTYFMDRVGITLLMLQQCYVFSLPYLLNEEAFYEVLFFRYC